MVQNEHIGSLENYDMPIWYVEKLSCKLKITHNIYIYIWFIFFDVSKKFEFK